MSVIGIHDASLAVGLFALAEKNQEIWEEDSQLGVVQK